MRRASLSTFSVAFTLSLPALSADAGLVRIYITNSAGDSIHVIDPATNKVVQEIKGIEAAHGIGFATDGSKVYVSNEADSTLDVFDRESGKLIKQIKLSDHPNNIAVTKNGDRVVVAIAREPGALDIIDTATLTLKKTIPVNGRLHNVYVTPDGRYAVMGSIPKKLITVVDFATRKEVTKIKLPEPTAEFETDSDRATAPSHGIGVAPDRKTLWVTSIPNNAVYVYSLADLSLVGQVALPATKLPGHKPLSAVANWVTFTPDSQTVYISNASMRSVTAIDMKAMKVVATIPVGEVPKRINTMVMN